MTAPPAPPPAPTSRVTREELIAAATVLHDEECRSCDRKYRMSCPNMASAILRSGRAQTAAPAAEAATPPVALAAEFDAAAASFEPDIARDGLDLDVGCRDTLHGCADAVRERLAPQWADLAARLAEAQAERDRYQRGLSDAEELLALAYARLARVREIVFQGGQDGESVRRELIEFLTIRDDTHTEDEALGGDPDA